MAKKCITHLKIFLLLLVITSPAIFALLLFNYAWVKLPAN